MTIEQEELYRMRREQGQQMTALEDEMLIELKKKYIKKSPEPPKPPDIQEEPMKISEKDTPALYAVMEGKAPREDCSGCPFNNLSAEDNQVSCQIVGKEFKKGLELTPCNFENWETKARTEARALFGGAPRVDVDDHHITEVANALASSASKATDRNLADNRAHHGNRPWRNGDTKADAGCPVYPAELKVGVYHGMRDLVIRIMKEVSAMNTGDPEKSVNLAEFMILMASLTGRISALEDRIKEMEESKSTEVAGVYEPEI